MAFVRREELPKWSQSIDDSRRQNDLEDRGRGFRQSIVWVIGAADRRVIEAADRSGVVAGWFGAKRELKIPIPGKKICRRGHGRLPVESWFQPNSAECLLVCQVPLPIPPKRR